MKNKRLISSTLLAALAATLPLHAATVSWDGQTNETWGTAANWNPDGVPGADDDVIINIGTGLNASRRLNFNVGSASIQSLTVGLDGLVFRATSGTDRSLTIGASDTGSVSFITMNGNAHNTEHSFTSSGTANRLIVQFGHQITLTGNGTGEYRFARSVLTNTSSSTGTDTIIFAGSGNWGFINDGVQASALEKTSANATLDVELKSGANAFTGTLRYATTNAMNVDNVRVNSGTLRLENATLTTTGNSTVTGLTVGADGTFGGTGTVNGSATIAGKLTVGLDATNGTLTFNNGLTLQAGSETRLDIGSLANFDRVALDGGSLVRGGTLFLTLSGAYADGDSWTLFTGLDGATGSFTSIVLNGQALNQSGDIWSGTYNDLALQFNQATGILALSSAIPEPSTMALLFGACTLALVIVTRRR